ncbi:hypothetical protein N7474_003425 [Penicillium riverlandense]|uniref:uncharacterized protein n=1 Tax=Penicillium riverlandense TaxID=1903569 RepID=UPI002547604C|nr:uncharacterized protein N7474_003425 [Penicillium riverlandense]KAJ5826287.1 hypothetical protein N7474_003425 [Penicillium riverlandense]
MRPLRLRLHHAQKLAPRPRLPITHFSTCAARHDLHPLTRRLFKFPSAPTPSTHHHDLPSFLSYAERISLPQTSTVYVGTHYEYTVLHKLRQCALNLHRVGGRDDAGIDLVGTWHLPERERELALRVVVQCKSLKTKLGPNLVRELEGALRNAPVGWRTEQTVGMLVSPREATKGVRDAMARSGYPLLWMMIERDGTMRQALWNARAELLGLEPLGVETRYTGGDGGGDLSEKVSAEVALTWDGGDIGDMDYVEQTLARAEDQWAASWGVAPSEKAALLDAIESLFPEKSISSGPEGVSASDRMKVLQMIQERARQRPGE